MACLNSGMPMVKKEKEKKSEKYTKETVRNCQNTDFRINVE